MEENKCFVYLMEHFIKNKNHGMPFIREERDAAKYVPTIYFLHSNFY